MDPLAGTALRAWTPVRVRVNTGEIDWALVDERFTDPFFEQTVDRAMQHPFNLAFARRTPLAVLDAVDVARAVAPTGFVFHMSRCGSTLIAQMLARLSATIVLSEPQPLDALLRLRGRGIDDDTLIRWFRRMLSALAEPRDGEQRLFVKFHAWHVLELPFIARAFPDVPWVFVFREPGAVLRSQARLPGAEVMPGTIDPTYLGLDPAAADQMPPAEYRARVVAAFCGAALQWTGPRATCIRRLRLAAGCRALGAARLFRRPRRRRRGAAHARRCPAGYEEQRNGVSRAHGRTRSVRRGETARRALAGRAVRGAPRSRRRTRLAPQSPVWTWRPRGGRSG